MTTRLVKSQKKYELEKAKKVNSAKWDKRSVISLLLFSCFVGLFCIILSIDIKGFFIRNNKNWITTSAKIESIDNQNIVEQTKAGSINKTLGYNFRYTYVVNDVVYNKNLYLPKPVSQKLVNLLRKNNSSWVVEIYYKENNPDESYINIDIDSYFYKK